MRIISLVLLLASCAFSKTPQFENAQLYTADENKESGHYSNDYDNEKPYGFTRAILPHPPNANRPNPVYEITGLEGRQIEIRAQVIQKGATICVRDNEEGPDGCSPDTINQCYAASKDSLKFEFYCMESCQSSDVNFFFRIIKSEVGADDLWCTNRETDGYPKDLIPGFLPPDKPSPPTTPAPPIEGDSSGMINSPSTLLVLLVVFFAATFLN